MKKRSAILTALTLIAGLTLNLSAGDTRMRMKVDKKILTGAGKVAIVAFTGNSVVSGNMGIGSLVTGMMANKGENKKVALDDAYFSSLYDSLTNALTQEGYSFVAADDIVKAKSYQEATSVEMPSMVNGKGLKNLNTNKAEALKNIAAETKADLILHFTSGHTLGMRSNIGVIAGKQVGISTLMAVVYDANGKKLGFIDASEVSDQSAGAVAGGFSDPAKVLPMLKEADLKVIASVAAAISKK